MSSHDDPSNLPPSRRGRPHRGRRERSGQDWRYPDPVERYGQEYEDRAPPVSYGREPDDWSHSPETANRDASFEAPRGREPFDTGRGWDRPAPSWDEPDRADDPFEWDAPEPPAEPTWREHDLGHESYGSEGFERGAFDAEGAWDRDGPDRFGASRISEPEPQGARRRDDSLFRRIDGSAQDPDLAALTGRAEADPFAADPYDGDPAPDPSALGDRFFSGVEPTHQDYDDRHSPETGNVFQFERYGGQPAEPDDPYGWDDGYEVPQPPFDPPAAHADPYVEQPIPYDRYGEDDGLHPDDDLDADFLDEEPDAYTEPAPERRSRRKLMVAGVLVAAVATGGGAAFVYKSYQDGSLDNLEAPTLLADSGPVKGEPSDPGGKEFPDGNKQIYDRLSGEPAAPASDDTAQSDSSESASIPGIVTTGAEAPADTLDERIAQALRRSGSPASETTGAAQQDPNAPRAVRTLTVRPDGSVVPAATPSPSQPSDTQTVTTAGIVATTGSAASEADAATPAAATPEENAATSSIPQASATAPRPERAAPRPAEPEETRVASAEPATTAATQPQTASANPYFVQLAARRDQTSALAAFADLQQKYPSILDGLAPTIKKADLGDKGIWYRLWVGPMDSRGNAQDVCGKLKNAGLGGCFVRTE